MKIIIPVLAGYLLGCFNAAYYYARLKGVNIFLVGSGNGGATNISRNFGMPAALGVFAVDVLKMMLALYLASYISGAQEYVLGLTMFAVMLGHVYPLQLGFHGGKGVACVMGAGLYFVSWKSVLILLSIFAVAYLILKLKTQKPYKKATYLTMFVSPFVIFFDVPLTVFGYLMACFLLVLYKTLSKKKFIFKTASTKDEFEQIYTLNYQTFSEEIPQHAKNEQKKLIDKFHSKNTYIICKYGAEVAGMVALNTKRPFSLDSKIENLDAHLPQDLDKNKLCEVRLLSIKKEYRKGRVLQGLIEQIFLYKRKHNLHALLISGTTREIKMYQRFGFQPFYQLVGTPGAMYQPMIMNIKETEANKWKR
ncbi:acyl-phosphate glycerol 3-phosphate acyltransferase [Elusimicrobium posterum]|uniref:glycerol-3-phosphate acyltransferase n=1 Tax=Elusimicrobium posterum TaxID=3116653 RepID=UPI003C795CE9